ncbi:Putative multidrug export ATP-binding/permease protein [Thalassocella blandensis]|nr:Putative multidrug export ATP-binding/permease protein [Thalassocella blandensis]
MYAFFEKLLNPFPTEEPQQPPRTFFAFCRYWTRGSEKYLILMALFSGLAAALEVSFFAFLGDLVDLLNNNTPDTLLDQAGGKLLFMAIMVLVALPLVFFFHSTLIHQTILGNFAMAIRWNAHRFLLGQSVEFYQNEFAGRLATKVMQTALAVRETVLKLLDVMLYVAVYFGGIIFLAVSLDIRLAIPFIGWLCIYVILLKYFLPRLSRISAQQAEARSDMTGRIVDTYTNIATVKLFSHANREYQYAREGMNNFLKTVYPQMRLVTSLSTAVWFTNGLLAFSISALSVYLWLQDGISSGAIAAAIGLSIRIFGMSQWIMWETSSLFENMGTARDGMETLARARDVQDAANAKQLEMTGSDGIRFDQVDFHYGKKKGIIENFDLHIRPGEKVGLIGRSGAGKSTLVNLLLRFYDVEKGRISIDGQDIRDVTQHSLRAQIGMVTQDTSLLHRSIQENVTYGKPQASDEEISTAIAQAHAVDFIHDLQDSKGRQGLDAHVGERGVKLSGGQRQRIAIARVLLKNAPILILDEATSALDSEVEMAIQENLTQLMQNKTVIAIAHRLSTIAALDRLIVVDEGKIIEQGTHKELLALNGVYAHLWAHQSGGFLAED